MTRRVPNACRTRLIRAGAFLVAALWAGFAGGCDDCNPPKKGPTDPHVVPDGRGLEPRRDVISPVTLRAPIYACANTALVHSSGASASISRRFTSCSSLHG